MNHTTFLTFFLPVSRHDLISIVRTKKKIPNSNDSETNEPFIS